MANEDKAARYQRLRRRTSLLDTSVQGSLLTLFALSGASTLLRAAVESLAGANLIPVVVLYVMASAAFFELTHLPFAFYGRFLLEKRYGLSTETVARWAIDHVKAAAMTLAALIGAALVVVSLLRWSPAHWWLLAAIVYAAALILLARFAPVLLRPRFYDVRPLDSEALRARLLALTERAGVPVLGVYEWRIGDRTVKGNAALVGIGRTRRILVSDTLLAKHSDDEIETVFAHELAHHVYGDIWSALALEAALLTLGCYLADIALSALGGTIGLTAKADVAGLPLLALTAGAASVAFTPLVNALSRAHERRADRYALETTENSPAFISAMKRLAAANLAEERPSRWVEVLFHTHPATAARIEAAREWTRVARSPTFGPIWNTREQNLKPSSLSIHGPDHGPRTKDQGPRTKDQGPRTKDQDPLALPGSHHQLSLHLGMPGVARQIAIEGERPRTVGPELERRRAARRDPA